MRPRTTASWTTWCSAPTRCPPRARSPDTARTTRAEAFSMSDLIRPASQLAGAPGVQPVESRYIIPSFVERTTYGVKEMNPYNKLFEERIIFLGIQIDDASANDVMAQLFTLESIDPDRDINIYINSPGGCYTAMTAIYGTMQFV